jgi:hypothetical protein
MPRNPIANLVVSTEQRSFYVTAGSFASAYLIYRFTKAQQESGSESFFSDLIAKWTPSQESFEQRNAIHTAIMEKAAEDRHLLQSEGPREFVPLRQNEYVIPLFSLPLRGRPRRD